MVRVVDLDMDMLVVGEHRLIGMGPILGIASHWDPRNRMCLMHLGVDSSLDAIE